MSLLTLVIAFVVVGVVLWAINTYVPMDSKIKTILNIAVIIIMVVWLLEATGLIPALGRVQVPHTH